MSKSKSKSTTKNLIAGGGAGAIEAMIMYPTEFVKTQLQLQGGNRGALALARDTVASKGVLGLYKGLSTLVVGSIPKASVRFAAFSYLSTHVFTGELNTAQTLACGLGAGVAEAVIAVTPTETIKTKMINDQNLAKPQYRGLVHGVSSIIRNEGLGGVYKGVVPTMMKQGTNQMVRFLIYGKIKKFLSGNSGEVHLWQSLVGGSAAGFVSVYVTMPFDVVKTRMQGLEASRYKSTPDCFVSILKNEGVLAFWKGTGPRLGRVCFSGAITFASYETLMKYILVVWPDVQ